MLIDDIKVIADALLEEAMERDWCSLYNDFVEEVNSKLQVSELKSYIKTYEVEVRVERKQYATVTVEVEANDTEGAEEYINTLSFDEILDQSKYGQDYIDWEETDEEYEIEYVREV